MAARIAAHRRERPAHWRVREEPVHLGRALRKQMAWPIVPMVCPMVRWSIA